MIRNEKLTAIIPVRGGSKGIPRKNLYKLGNFSLLERTIIQAKKSSKIDEIIVSTDDAEMYSIAEEYNVQLESLRPEILAEDNALTIDVINHALSQKKINKGHIILLQVTSPFRILKDFKNIFDIYEHRTDCSSVISVNKSHSTHPDKIQIIEKGFLKSYLGKESMVPRQYLPEVYELNGAFYLTSIDFLKKNRSFFSDKVIPYEMNIINSLNLDSLNDLYLLEYLVDNKKIKIEEY